MCNILHARSPTYAPLPHRRCCATRCTSGVRDAIVDGTLAPRRGRPRHRARHLARRAVVRPVREALLPARRDGPACAPPPALDRGRRDRPAPRSARPTPSWRRMHRLAVGRGVARLTTARPRRDASGQRALRRVPCETGTPTPRWPLDDAFHAVAVDASGNRALATVLDQFSPRRPAPRAAPLRLASPARSRLLHDPRHVPAWPACRAAADVAVPHAGSNLADLIPPTCSPGHPTPDPQETP